MREDRDGGKKGWKDKWMNEGRVGEASPDGNSGDFWPVRSEQIPVDASSLCARHVGFQSAAEAHPQSPFFSIVT